jgi:hypothetical protein
MRAQTCSAIGCQALVLSDQVFRARHLAMVKSDVRRLLERTFRPGKKPSARFKSALEHARREILFMATNSHHTPKDRPFEWDDAPREEQ